MGVSKNLGKRQPSWNARASGGNPVGRNVAMGSDRLRTTLVTQANGRTVGNIGHPLSLTPITGGSKMLIAVSRRAAHLRSHSGHNVGIALSHAPTAPEYTVPPHLFRVLLLERLALPLPVTEARCSGCHELLDLKGHHLAACPKATQETCHSH